MKTLTLTSPLTKGPEVARVQHLLHENKYGDFYNDAFDGQLGELTAFGFHRAKYWVGYSEGSLDKFYGDSLDHILKGTTTLTDIMQARRDHRLALAQQTPLRSKMFNIAVTQLNTKEDPPNSNIVKYSKAYGIIGPWCNEFVTWCGVQAGSITFVEGQHYAYVPYMVFDARMGRNNLTVVSAQNVKQGDVTTYDWDKDGTADHTGFFDKWIDQAAGTFYAVEGNTAVGADSDGGEVMRRQRSMSDVQVLIHVGK